MGIREWANGHPKVMAGAVGTLVVFVGGAAVVQMVKSRRGYPSGPPDSYFTTDDGKTWFAAPSDNYPPFDHNGSPAVRAYVFECGGKKFVGFLERFAPDVRTKLDAAHPPTAAAVRTGREIKRPGDAKWTRTGDMATENKIENVSCPDGSGGTPDEVEP